MKTIFTLLLTGIALYAAAQADTLRAGVYSPGEARSLDAVEKREIVAGKTHDLQYFGIHTYTLNAHSRYVSTTTGNQFELLVIVKEGALTITLNDTTKTVGPGSLALVLTGDMVGFINNSNAPASYYMLMYKSKNPVDMRRGRIAGPSFIKDWNTMRVNKTTVGESRPVFDRATTMFGRFDVHATGLNPGQVPHPPHVHRAEEVILMLKGSVQEQIAQDKFMAHAGDCILLTTGILHGPKNIGTEQAYYYAIQWHNLKTD